MNTRTVSFYQDEPFVQEAFESILKAIMILKSVCAQNHLLTSPEIKIKAFSATTKLWGYSLKAADETAKKMSPEEKFLIQDLEINSTLGTERAKSNLRRLWDLLYEAEKNTANGISIQDISRASDPLDTTFRISFKD